MYRYIIQRIRHIKRAIEENSIQKLLFIYFICVSIIAVALITIPLYLNYTKTVENMVKEKNIQVINETNRYLDSNLEDIVRISDAVYNDIIKDTDLANESIDDKINLISNANKKEVVNIILFNKFGKIESSDTKDILKPNIDTRKNTWFTGALEKDDELYFSTPHVQDLFSDSKGYNWVVSLSRVVDIMKNEKEERGLLLIDVNFTGIEKVCKDANLGSDGYIYLVSKNGELIYHPRQQMIYSGIEKENTDWVLSKEDGSYTRDFNGQKKLITIKTVGYTGCKLVAVTPINEIINQYSKIRLFIFISLVFVLFAILYLSLFIAHKIASPIEKLEKSVQEIEKGNFETIIPIEGTYETRHLGKTIKSMVKEMRILMENVIAEQEAKKRSEFEALQSQINPHFLYNTLDSIIWMIENKNYDGAVTMVISLARLFRISLSKGKNIITVKEELEHARHYLTIQSIRYKNKFTYSIIAEEEVLKIKTVKLIVQPMIENAIYHGMRYMTEGEGKITIKAYLSDDRLIIEIRDNGIGIPQKILKGINDNKDGKEVNGFGIGIKNVNERIKLIFGDRYGLKIFSEADEGTTISLEIPVLKDDKLEKEGFIIEK